MIIEYGEDVAEPPTHLNVAFFEEVVENALHEANLKIERVRFTMGSSTGENYCSQIFRARVQYRLEGSGSSAELSVIVKSLPYREAEEFLQEMRVFQKERTIYYEILPQMEMFLNNGERFSARLYHCVKRPVNTLVFEDLISLNFEMASREVGLDEAHCRLVMRHLGKFHAISMLFARKHPDIMKLYNSALLQRSVLESGGTQMSFCTANAHALLEQVGQWPGYERILSKLQRYVANLCENLSREQDLVPNELRVLNHGDVWTNNIFFKYDQQGSVCDVTFVDYQMSMWASPGLDLNYFLYTSPQLDVLKNKREELIREYYHTLRDTLHQIGYDEVPSYQQIQDEVRRRASYGFFAHFVIYPLVCMDKQISGDSCLTNLADNDFAQNKARQMYATKRLQDTMKYTLKEFDKMGIWD